MRENTGSGEAGVRMKQEDGAILREEELFHRSGSEMVISLGLRENRIGARE